MSATNPVPAYHLYCNKHKQSLVEFVRRQMKMHRCETCVAEARAKVQQECLMFQSQFGKNGPFNSKLR